MVTVDQVIDTLKLVPLEVEGGMYRCVYSAEQTTDGKSICSVIYYLLTRESFSHMHRLPTDEVYYFFLGDPVELLELMPDGSHKKVILGHNITENEQVHTVVPAGCWQGSHLKSGDGTYGFALLGTSMAPAYGPGDYEHGQREALCSEYPKAAELIRSLTGKAVFR